MPCSQGVPKGEFKDLDEDFGAHLANLLGGIMSSGLDDVKHFVFLINTKEDRQ